METILIKNESGVAPEIIKNGGLVAVPTETVYGLAASGLDSDAVAKIYEVKNRPEVKPISLLVSGMEDVEKFCREIPKEAYIMAEKFWPGPLTMILWRKPEVPDIVTSGGETVGVRCPDHEVTLDIIKKAGVPLAAPSANMSGCPSPKNIEQVLNYIDGKIECAVDGGQCSVGVESTIVDMTHTPFRILRMGGLSRETILEEAGIETI